MVEAARALQLDDLIDGARTAISPHAGLGRGMKVGKEEIAGLVAAVERYTTLDLEAERRALEAKVQHLKDVVGKVKGVTVETSVPEIANRRLRDILARA